MIVRNFVQNYRSFCQSVNAFN